MQNTRRKPAARRTLLAAAAAFALAAGTMSPLLDPAPTPALADVTVSGVVNTYQKVSAVSGNVVTVTGATAGATAPFAVGDHVMLIQMTGVSPSHPGSNMGNYDNATITAISGSQITLSGITRTYSPDTEAVQLVRAIHDAGTVTVSGTVTAKAWDGTTGGVVAVSGGTLQLNATIDASETGFTNANPPTGTTSVNRVFGAGSTTGRGFEGERITADYTTSAGGSGGGGIGGGGGWPYTAEHSLAGRGGDRGGTGLNSVASYLNVAYTSAPAAGVGGGLAVGHEAYFFGGALAGAGGGGGVTGGGGGGGAYSRAGGGGGGVAGGGGGGRSNPAPGLTNLVKGAGGGGTYGVGNGGDGVPGGPNGPDDVDSKNEGSSGGGGGSYGGGGGAPTNHAGGDDSAGGGGGGSWTGGGAGGSGGLYSSSQTTVVFPSGGKGNDPVNEPIPDDAHFLNASNPRLMMGGAGGRGSAEIGTIDGGAGGGIVYADFRTIAGTGDIRSDGGEGASPADFGGGAHSGAGGGAGGQMRIRAVSVANPMVFAVNGGVGGTPTSHTYHGGVSGGGGGAGGIWLELANATPECPADGAFNVTFELAGGNGGPSIVNPKNQAPTGTGGAGGSGLGCVSTFEADVELAYEKTSNPAAGTMVQAGDEITYTVTIRNDGAEPSTNGFVTDDMADVLDKATMTTPPALACAPVANSCGELTYTSGQTTFEWSSSEDEPIDGETTATITYTVQVDDEATGTVGNVLVEPDVTVEHPILDSAKVVDVGGDTLVNPGDTVTYTITITNTGDVDASEFSVYDDLSDVVDKAELDEDSIVIEPAIGSAVYDPDTKRLTWTGALAADTSVDVSYSVTVNENAFGELRNHFLEHEVVNPLSASLQWNKVDPEGDALAGSEWTLQALDANGDPQGDPLVIVDCTEAPCTGVDTDPAPGAFLVKGLEPGEYVLIETRAPVGYVLDDEPIDVTVVDDAAITVLDDIENRPQGVPELPLTGGLGSDSLFLGGGAFLALTAGLIAWQLVRRRRMA